MKKRNLRIIALALSILMLVLVSGCGKGPKAADLPTFREISWEGKELTVSLGANRSSGCVWSVEFEDDSIIGYSINRVFHLVDNMQGLAIGYSAIGFEGKSEGTAKIFLTTPCGWDGSGEGLKYVVTATVNADGTVKSAVGEDG